MTVTLEIPGELAHRLGADAGRLSREALGLEAYRQELRARLNGAADSRSDAWRKLAALVLKP